MLELLVGHYRLEAAAKGFQKYVQDGITLNVNETVDARVRLVVGAETQQAQVTEDAELIQGTVTSLGKLVLEKEIVELPLDGRSRTFNHILKAEDPRLIQFGLKFRY